MQRILWVIATAGAVLVFVAVMQSHATPIQPDLNKVLQESQEPRQFPLARAGWNGPEKTGASRPVNETYEELGPEASARQARAALRAAAIPDYRAVAGILLVILLLRRIHLERKTAPVAVPAGLPGVTPDHRPDTPDDFKRAA